MRDVLSLGIRSARWTLAFALVTTLSVPALAESRPPRPPKGKTPPHKPELKLPGVKVYKEEEADKHTLKRTKGPQFKLNTARTRRDRQANVKRELAIQTLLELLQIQDPKDPEYPKALVKLADQYWQKSEDFFDRSQSDQMLKRVYDAEERKDVAALAQARAEQQRLVSRQRDWRRKAIETYRQIERDHPTYKDLDQVLYSIGYHSTVMGDRDMGYKYYAKLVLERPTSDLIPDTYLNIGDYFFGNNDFQQALAFYAKVEQFGATRVLGYAIYKSGWCWFNLGDKAKAMNRFYDTVKWTREAERQGHPAAIDLRGEAQNDMVRAYSYIGAPQKAVGFFKRIAPEIYMKLCEKLGLIYTTDGNFSASNRLYRKMIQEVGDNYRAFSYQREIVYNTFKWGDKKATVAEVAGMTGMLEKYLDQLPAKLKAEETKELEMLLRIIGTDYHREAEKTLSHPDQVLALRVYDVYLKWFPDAPDYYTMNFNVAILAYQMGEYDVAARRFEKVIELDPKGPFTGQAAHTVVLAYFKLVNLQTSEEKTEDIGDEFEPAEIPPLEAKFVHACERYIALAEPGADDVGECTFAAGKIFYDYNHFKEATALFAKLYETHREHVSMPDAARLLLSIFNVTRDIRNLNKWADIFAKDAAIAQGELGQKISEIQAARDFNKCRLMEFDKQFSQAADCFMAYFRDFPNAKLGDTALANAAIMYMKAKRIERALVASEKLYNERQDSPKAPQALYNIGQIYQAIAVYSEAAYYYEIYAKNHPKHNRQLLEKALARAATFRAALGQYDKAVKDYLHYYKVFSETPKAPLVFFEIGDLYFEQNNWRAVLKHFKRYLKTYGKTAKPAHVIAAHSLMGRAYWNSKKKSKALKEFAAALAVFGKLRAEAKAAGKEVEMEARGADAVAAAKFYQGEVVLTDMKAIKLKLPQKKFAALLGRKIKLIQEATQRMQEVAAFERPHWEIAAFNRIGQAYQNLADAIETAPIPRRMPEEAKYMLQEEFQKKANAVRAKAVEAYQICLKQAKARKWFNEFSENAEKNLAKLDLNYKFTRELRPQPGFYRHNASVPRWKRGSQPAIPKTDDTPGKPASATTAAIAKATLPLVEHHCSIDTGSIDTGSTNKSGTNKGGTNKSGVRTCLPVRDWDKQKAKAVAAIAALKAVVQKGGKDGAIAQYDIGLVQLHQRRYSAALDSFKAAAAADAQLADAHAMVGVLMRRLGQPGDAQWLDAALKLEKFNPVANNMLAVKAQEAKDWNNAFVAARKALIGDAESLNAYQNLARAYFEQKQFEMARLVAKQALEFDPNNAALHNLLGLTHIRLKNVRAALRSFERAVEANPASVESRLNLGATATNYSDFEVALPNFRGALAIEKDNVAALMGAAVAARGLKQYDEAERLYDRIAELEPNNVDVRYNKCLLLGQYAEKYEPAVAVCEEFVRMAGKDNPRLKEVKRRVKGLKDTIRFMKEDAAAAAKADEGDTTKPDKTPAEGDKAPGDKAPAHQ